MRKLLLGVARLLLLGAASGLLPAALRAEESVAYFNIPVDVAPDVAQPLAKDGPVRVVLEAVDPERLVALLARRGGVARADGRVELLLGAYRPADFTGERDWLAPSFFVDYEDAPVPELVGQLRASHRSPQPSDIVRFVADVVQGSYDRGIDVASRVARDRRGDCTEFAVLTTALARAAGLPARVVLGVALNTHEGRIEAYGHAWSEIAVQGSWQVADAALVPIAGSIRYLPLGVLENEGPGYVMGVAQLMPGWVKRISILPAQM